MKKQLFCLLTAVLVFGIIACSNPSGNNDTDSDNDKDSDAIACSIEFYIISAATHTQLTTLVESPEGLSSAGALDYAKEQPGTTPNGDDTTNNFEVYLRSMGFENDFIKEVITQIKVDEVIAIWYQAEDETFRLMWAEKT